MFVECSEKSYDYGFNIVWSLPDGCVAVIAYVSLSVSPQEAVRMRMCSEPQALRRCENGVLTSGGSSTS
ncbi:hypothetical protein NQZ68_008449 [Dissostichus eleginoides]|nr:hypothetical protein NQZ68_008449 [Dissostichus eleginoides]